ncbi:MAG: cytochrome b/b6 domain-containing protein [Nitrososphaerales archaeon]
MSEEKVLRWALAERIEHLLIMVLIPTFIITGLPTFDMQLFGWMIVPPITIDLFRVIHRIAAGLYIAVAIFHVFYHTIALRSTKMGVSFKDIKDSIGLMKYYAGLSNEKPKIGFHNPTEKIIVYWGMAVWFMLFMGISGIILMYPGYFPSWVHEWALVIHDLFFLLTVFVLLFHFYMSTLYKEHRPLLDGMFTDGMVPVEYIKEHHSLWYEELKRKK